jgi:hypothetical protein
VSLIDLISTDKGWSIEYCQRLTYRQVWFFIERYWDRKALEVAQAVHLNPFTSGKEKGKADIDATGDGGLAQLRAMGIPVKGV